MSFQFARTPRALPYSALEPWQFGLSRDETTRGELIECSYVIHFSFRSYATNERPSGFYKFRRLMGYECCLSQMSCSKSVSCVTCEARNKKYDETRNPFGCRRCSEAGIECEGYLPLNSRIPKTIHRIGESQPPASTMYHDCSIDPNKIPGPIMTSHTNTLTLSLRKVLPSGQNRSTAAATLGFGALDRPTSVSVSHQYTNSHPGYSSIPEQLCLPSTTQIATPIGQSFAPPVKGTLGPHASIPIVVPSQANLPDSHNLRLSIGWDPGATAAKAFTMGRAESSVHSKPQLTLDWTAARLDNEPEIVDSENIKVNLLDSLALDPQLGSNMILFLVDGFVSWATRFIFDTTQILPIVANYIRFSPSFPYETRMTMLLTVNVAVAISSTTDYDLTDFMTLHK
ncbi:hypothetical protein B0J17DRAFT_42333 [Rhizoctonia solani]|nr:hypothetical protein B0J17DRAFT_42333 [Rhizoctonia solani]